LIAIGDLDGVVNMMELSDSLYSPIPKKEKETLDIMFDRELKREKNLDNAKKAPEK